MHLASVSRGWGKTPPPPVVTALPVCRGEVVVGSLLLQAKVVDHSVLPGKRLAADAAVKAAAAAAAA